MKKQDGYVKDLMSRNYFNDESQKLFIRTLCQNILREIDSRNIPVSRLSRDTGISNATLSRIVNQKQEDGMSVTTLYKIAKALNMEVSQLIPSLNISTTEYTDIFNDLIRNLSSKEKEILLEQISYWIKALKEIARTQRQK